MAGEVKKLEFADGVTVSSPSDLGLGAADAEDVNLLINGGYDFWQRGVGPLTSNTTSAYKTADRYYLRSGGGGATFSTERNTDTPNTDFRYSLKYIENGDASGNTGNIMQRIEAADIRPYIGEEMTASIWLKKNNISASFTLQTATPVSASEDVWNADLTADTTQDTQVLSIIDNTWEQHTITFTVPAAAANGLAIWLAVGVYTGILEFYTTGWLLNVGDSPLSIFRKAGNTMADELQNCQRFYEKSVNVDQATRTGNVNVEYCNVGSTGVVYHSPRWKTTKRANPTVTNYDSVTGTSGQITIAGVGSAATASSPGQSGAIITDGGNTAGDQVKYHWDADSEL